MVKSYLLQPAYFRLDGGAMYGIIPKPLWNKKHPSDELNRIDLALRLWVIKTKDRVICIDTGIGDYHSEKFIHQFDIRGPSDPLTHALSEINLKKEDITDLVLSHLHFDHVGGLTEIKNEKPICAFPNATIHLHKDHYDYSLKASLKDSGSFHKENYQPIIESFKQNQKLAWLQGDQGIILEDNDYKLQFRISHGHTPFLVHPYDEFFIYLADIIPTSHHIHIPWIMAYDIEPTKTAKYKQDILDFVIEKDLTVIFEHDPDYWGSKVMKNEKNKYIAKAPFDADRFSVIKI
ncbi:MAG: MBL fold metallo-hydrolase [Bacteriovoracaceae bacterium]